MASSAEQDQRIWQRLSAMFTASPALVFALLVASLSGAVLFGVYLTPPTYLPTAPFVVPILLAAFQNSRWIWAAATVVIPTYAIVGMTHDLPISSLVTNVAALIVFSVVFTWVSKQRQHIDEQAEALLTLERNLKFAMRSSDLRLFSHDLELRYTWVPNPVPAFPLKRMLGATDADLFPPDEARELMAIKRRALDEDTEVNAEVRVTRHGEQRIDRLTVVPSYATVKSKRMKTGITCIAIDVTEFKRIINEREELARRQEAALADAARAQENLERFMSMIAHDLVQPLTVIQGYGDVLRRQFGTGITDRQTSALDAVSRSVVQMMRLIEDLRDVAALEQGRFSLHYDPVELVGVIGEAISGYKGTTELHTINLDAPDQIWGHVDPERVSQLMGNLISNAVKYSPEGGNIDVRARAARGTCTIEVSDEGMGISPEKLDTLFEMFTRLDSSQRIQGLGLGLYISNGIVEAHGGSIHAESEPGKGSTFTVSLPLAPRVDVEDLARVEYQQPQNVSE